VWSILQNESIEFAIVKLVSENPYFKLTITVSTIRKYAALFQIDSKEVDTRRSLRPHPTAKL